jgi:O-antigen/teichoic acid export membrane protein
LSDFSAVEVTDVPAELEWTRVERVFLAIARRVPWMAETAGTDRVLTAFRGSVWTIVGYGGSQVLRLVSMVILARHLLGPQAFGLVALVNVFLSGLSLFTDLGIGTDVIQHKRGDEAPFVNTAFLIQAVRGSLLFLIAASMAYPFAHFYHQPEIRLLAIVASISVLVQGFSSGSVWTRTRHVQLGTVTLLRIGAEVTGLVVSIVWAVVSPTAWAIVVGRVAAELFFTIGSHFMRDQWVSLKWDSQAAKEILAFGTGMFVSSATYFLAGESERLVIGKFITLAMLGCFSLALSITSTATQGILRLLAQVFFPMIAVSVRKNVGLAASQYRKARLTLLVASGGIAVSCIVGGNFIVAHVLGPKYSMAGWMLQLLGFRAALELFTALTTQMLFALGTSKYAAAGNICKLAFLGVGLAIAFTKFGFYAAVWVLALSSLFAYIPLLYGIKTHFRQALRGELATFAAFIAISGAAAFVMKILG